MPLNGGGCRIMQLHPPTDASELAKYLQLQANCKSSLFTCEKRHCLLHSLTLARTGRGGAWAISISTVFLSSIPTRSPPISKQISTRHTFRHLPFHPLPHPRRRARHETITPPRRQECTQPRNSIRPPWQPWKHNFFLGGNYYRRRLLVVRAPRPSQNRTLQSRV